MFELRYDEIRFVINDSMVVVGWWGGGSGGSGDFVNLVIA